MGYPYVFMSTPMGAETNGDKTNFLDNNAMKISVFFDEIINILAEIYRL